MPRVLLFGQIRECAEHLHGAELDTGATSVAELTAWLGQRHPELAAALARPGVRFAVDQCFATAGTRIFPSSEVALMSPLSGG